MHESTSEAPWHKQLPVEVGKVYPQDVGLPRIMLVDDDPSIRRLLGIYLRGSYDVIAFDAVDGALKFLGQQEVELIISDISMPDTTGIDLRRLLGGNADTDVIPFIFLTAHRDLETRNAVDRLAFDDYLVKPIGKERLLAVVNRVLKRVRNLRRRFKQGFEFRQSRLQEVMRRREQDYEKIKEDLDAAAQLQRNLLPTITGNMLGIGIDGLFVPAATLAGDMYGFFPLDERHLGFYQLDVVGHGVKSAMLSVTLSRLLSADTWSPGRDAVKAGPQEVVAALNRQFQDTSNECNSYFTMVYGILDTMTGRVRICQAGHPTPLHLTRGKQVQLRGDGGLPVGMFPGVSYETVEFQFKSGDRLCLYSDGITECRNHAGRQFGVSRLSRFLHDTSHLSLHQALSRLKTTLRTWSGGDSFADDISLLILENSQEQMVE